MAYIKVINNTKTFPSGDETTGALDFETGRAVMQILQDMSRKQGSTVLIVTHNAARPGPDRRPGHPHPRRPGEGDHPPGPPARHRHFGMVGEDREQENII